jgi:hypothetical protein
MYIVWVGDNYETYNSYIEFISGDLKKATIVIKKEQKEMHKIGLFSGDNGIFLGEIPDDVFTTLVSEGKLTNGEVLDSTMNELWQNGVYKSIYEYYE